MAKRDLYLSSLPLEEALEQYLAALEGLLLPRRETIPASDALDRVTAQAVYARCSSPLYNAAAMDGIAVQAASTAGAAETRPVTLKRGSGFIVVDTGDPVNPPFDAVIMAEDIVEIDENTVQIREAAASWQHIRPIGEDIVAGEMALPSKHRVRPIDIGVLLSAGLSEIEVFQRPKVAVFPTGDEIIGAAASFSGLSLSAVPPGGAVLESNAPMLRALAQEDGAEAVRFPPVPDDPELLENAISDALASYDMVLINAGSSAGTEDYTAQVLRKLGKVVVHGVAMKPGKPVILAVAEGKPVIGIPGYPVSAYLAYTRFAAPVLALLTGRQPEPPQTAQAIIAKRLVSSLKHREYVRVKLGMVDGRLVASPLARGAGAAMSLVRADGFCVIPQNSEGFEAGSSAPVELSRPLHEIERTLVSIGSHDLILDVIADMMAGSSVFLASSHVGSMAGLMALKRGECHIAPIHLLDETSGGYNRPYLRRLFPGTAMALIRGVGRVQGLIVQKGNPLGLRKVADLTRCRYINRQRGAGTRLFLDYRLKQAGLSPEEINGYDREAATHMAAAAAVKSNSADAGMGIASAAAALDLDFIPLGDESYDFALYPRFLELPALAGFIAALQSEAFHRRLAELGGYTWEGCGEVEEVR